MEQLEFKLRCDISLMLKHFTDDYAGDIERALMDDIVSDVMECSDFENGFYSEGDISLAIGRVLCNRLGLER